VNIHTRDHDGSRIRVWTDEMRPYGQFEIIDRSVWHTFREVARKLGIMWFIHHWCDTDEECTCEKRKER